MNFCTESAMIGILIPRRLREWILSLEFVQKALLFGNSEFWTIFVDFFVG